MDHNFNVKFFQSGNSKTPELCPKTGLVKLYVPNDTPTITLQPGQSRKIMTGIYMRVPEGWALVPTPCSELYGSGLLASAEPVRDTCKEELAFRVQNLSNKPVQVRAGAVAGAYRLTADLTENLQRWESLEEMQEGMPEPVPENQNGLFDGQEQQEGAAVK